MNKKIIHIEKNILPAKNNYLLFISYKIPFSNLVFIKKEEKFFSGLEIEFNLFDGDKIINRKTISKNVFVDNYNDTKSNNNFLEGFTFFDIDKNDYTILPILHLHNTNNEIIFDSIKINLNNFIKDNIYAPIIIEDSNQKCFDSHLFKLTNYGNIIPFASYDYLMLIPVQDTSLKYLNIKIEQKGKILFEREVTKYYENNLSMTECDNIIGFLESYSNFPIRYFVIDNFNHKLHEGSAKLIITGSNKKAEFDLRVVWINKPKSLINLEFAIDILNVIEDKNVVAKILQNSKSNLYDALTNYWDKKFPDRKYQFNELMNEFYRRVDYANENFSTLVYKSGAKTDRGKIYIKYGQPDEILRNYSDGKVIEIWIYNNINKQFTFVDNSGLGNYMLEE
ncbi:MAG: GWxTD domain-containing protein [Melioribacter sp.]|uniref:GWxTD domain-containing protein n=1 Tax=Rosettibacter primus TaxID=3111523 RepID=UPI00247C7D6C|nr:GWxTD domain-containing protein [Melioribacter sp.]